MKNKLTLSVLSETFGICRMNHSTPLPDWAFNSDFFSITKTKEELSIVCPQNNIPTEIKSENEWRVLKIEGPIDFALTGILSSILSPLAKAGISIFAVSTYDTDYILVKSEKLSEAVSVLQESCIINM
jgi:hypothetical protein